MKKTANLKTLTIIWFFVCFSTLLYAQNTSKIQQLEKQLTEAKEDTAVINLQTQIAYQYARVDKEKAYQHLAVAEKLTAKTGYKKGRMLVLGAKAVIYTYEAKHDESTALYHQAIELAKELKDEEKEAAFMVNIGHNYTYQNKYPEALKYYNLTEDFATKTNNKHILAKVYVGKANIFSQSGRYKEAQQNIKKAIAIHKILGNRPLEGESYASMGHSFAAEKQHDSALVYFKKAVETFKAIGYLTYIPLAYADIGYELHEQGKYSEAIEYYQKAEKIYADSKRDDVIAPLHNYYGNALVKLNRFAEAEKHYQKALFYAKKDEDIEEERDALYGLFAVNKNLNRPVVALNYFEQYDELRNKVFKTEQLAKVTETEIKYETAKKEAQIALLSKDNRIKALTITAILIAFVTVGGAAFAYYNRQKLKQENRIQAEIHKQREIATKAIFEGEQNERIRIARDLHDGIGQMLSVVKMNLSTISPADKNVEGTANLVDKTIAEVRTISHNLIPEALNFGLFAALEDICQKIAESGNTKVNLHVADELKQQTFSQQNELSIYRIVQEVLNNMLKHAAASHISIDITKPNANMFIAIKDNGKGFDTEKINESKGIGWKNISARVHLLDGKMNIHSERLMGTTIEISIPDKVGS